MTPSDLAALRHVADLAARMRQVDTRKLDGRYRERALELELLDPPPVEIVGYHICITAAGRKVLAEATNEKSPPTLRSTG